MKPRIPLGSAPRILVVDDQPEVRLLFVTTLEMEGYEVHEAPTAAGGLAVLRDAEISLVLTDYAMPGGTGSEMLAAAQAEGLLARTAIVIITAHSETRELDAFDVWRKPVDLDEFLRQVRQLLGCLRPGLGCRSDGVSA